MTEQENDLVYEQYADIEQQLRESRERWRSEELAMIRQRDRCLRRMVGSKRGGVKACSARLGVSDMQVIRTLTKGTERSIMLALTEAGIENYTLVHQRGGRTIGVMSPLPDQTIIDAVNAVGDLQYLGREVVLDAAEAADLTKLVTEVTSALLQAEIPKKMFTVQASKQTASVDVMASTAAAGIGPEVLCRAIDVLADHPWCRVEETHDGLMVRRTGPDPEEPVALIFGWE